MTPAPARLSSVEHIAVPRAWLRDLCEANAAVLGRLLVERRSGIHLKEPLCVVGNWLTPGDAQRGGQPCSPRCQEAKRALLLCGEGMDLIGTLEPVQLGLLEPARKGA
jgi:hypothetical protein